MRTYRVTVRGRFNELTDPARAQLLATADQHDALSAAFTPEGTFTYERSLNAFSFRYLLTDDAEDPKASNGNVNTLAELNATEYLEANSYGFKDLRVESMSIDDMKASTRRLR